MPKNMQVRDIRTRGYVLRRTNYGEADRILNILTLEGKMAVIARGVRKTRSKLAGGVEMFTLAEYNIHTGKGELGTLTGAKMLCHYGEIVKDLARTELAGVILKKVSKAAENAGGGGYFDLVDTGLKALDAGGKLELIEAWFWLNLLRVMGEEVNLYRETNGEKLSAGLRYEWDAYEKAFVKHDQGRYGSNEIKLLRIMAMGDFEIIRRVKMNDTMMEAALAVARSVSL